MSQAKLVMTGARMFGVNLNVDDEDLTYHANYEPSPVILEKIASHENEIVAVLRTRRDAVNAIWTELQDVDADTFVAFINAKIEEIEILQYVLDQVESAAPVIIPEIRRNGGTWSAAVKRLLGERHNIKYEKRRPRGYSDEQWLGALYQARLLEKKDRRVTTRWRHEARYSP
jgi:hypothetical protein